MAGRIRRLPERVVGRAGRSVGCPSGKLHAHEGVVDLDAIVSGPILGVFAAVRDRYEVIAATSFIADVLSDVFAALDGCIGRAPSASLGATVAVFEPVHGSAPRRTGEVPGRGDPTGAIFATAMMLEHLGETTRATVIRDAVDEVGPQDGVRPTAEHGAAVAAAVAG